MACDCHRCVRDTETGLTHDEAEINRLEQLNDTLRRDLEMSEETIDRLEQELEDARDLVKVLAEKYEDLKKELGR